MSVPARAVRAAAPRPAPRRPTGTPRAATAPARRSSHRLGFAAASVAVAGALVLGLVTLNAMVAQSSFRVDDLHARVEDLSRHYALLERQAARLSAPGRIAAWAERHGMRLAPEGDLHILKVKGGGAPSDGRLRGGESAVDDPGATLKSIVGDG